MSERDPEQMPARRRELRFFLLTALALGALLVLALNWRSRQRIDQVRVGGVAVQSDRELLQRLDSAVIGRELDSVTLAEIRDSIARRPFVRKATVRRDGVRGLSIEVQEREAMAALVDTGGAVVYIDSAGVLLPYERYAGHADVPLVHGILRGGRVDSLALRSLVELIGELRGREEGLLYRLASEIHMDPAGRRMRLVSSESGMIIELGDRAQIASALGRVIRFWRNEMPGRDPRRIRSLDARWKRQIILVPRESLYEDFTVAGAR